MLLNIGYDSLRFQAERNENMKTTFRFISATLLNLCLLLIMMGCGVSENKRLTEEENETKEAVEAAQGETLSCELSASDNTVADHITYETGASCPDSCDACVYSDESEQGFCSDTCETDSECNIGEKCVGCFTLFACAKVCGSEGDCSFNENCESGICLPED
jgi:hypothetical protein